MIQVARGLAGVLVVGVSVVAGAQERRVIGGGPGQSPYPPPPISSSQSPAELSAALDRYLAKFAAEDTFSGVVLLAKDGVPVFEKAYGLAERTHAVPNTTATRFNLSSVNKQFTIAAIDLLVKDGKLKRDDTVGALLPEYPNAQARTATVEQLLGHRGGIADFFGTDFDAAPKRRFRSNADYFAFVAPRPLDFPPGTSERYCNGCYVVLGEIIARVSGMPYERFVAERIFAPRGMTRSGWFDSDEIVPQVAMGYTKRLPGAEGVLHANVFSRGAAGSAAGGGYSTAADLLAFFKAGATGSGGGEGDAIGIAGGSPGSAALVEMRGPWTAIVLSNLDPPSAAVGAAIVRQLSSTR